MSAVSLTSRWIAAARAQESARADRLFDDPFADALATAEGLSPANEQPPAGTTFFDQLILRAIRAFGAPYLAIRTRFLDDLLQRAVTEEGVRQVVILAAGMDARAFRLPWLADTRLFELDRPEVLAAKDEVLAGAGARAFGERAALGVDLADPGWVRALCNAGYDPTAPAAWLVEGLLMYLEEPVVRGLLQAVAELSAPGSSLGGDVLSGSFRVAPLAQPFLAMLEAQGTPWRFGTDTPEALFGECGWSATAVEPGERQAHYSRWPFPATAQQLTGIPWGFLVTARRPRQPNHSPRRTRRPRTRQRDR